MANPIRPVKSATAEGLTIEMTPRSGEPRVYVPLPSRKRKVNPPFMAAAVLLALLVANLLVSLNKRMDTIVGLRSQPTSKGAVSAINATATQTFDGLSRAAYNLAEAQQRSPLEPSNKPAPAENVSPPIQLQNAEQLSGSFTTQITNAQAKISESLLEVKVAAPLQPSVVRGQQTKSALTHEASQRRRTRHWSSADSIASLWRGVKAGSIDAERVLAERFARGDGVAVNCDQAKVLLKAAANRGSREALPGLDELEIDGCR